MTPTRRGSYQLFRVFGISVYLHWSWFIVALIEIQWRRREYSSILWNALEYLALFAIVLLHEFGHSLACRQVGGKADQIVLWPLGGVAYVSPPQRPGATLWSIAAGPLVNVLLFPVLKGLLFIVESHAGQSANAYILLLTIHRINLGLLIFNLLPVYPLDGGQILRSLLWFLVGRAPSLIIASALGLVGGIGLAAIAFLFWLLSGDVWPAIWLGILAMFLLLNSWRSLLYARALSKIAAAPTRADCRCPRCETPPPMGDWWGCGRCRKLFDMFAAMAVCPHCGVAYENIICVHCGERSPAGEWMTIAPPPKVF